MKCSNCENEVSETDNQCPHCGAVFKTTFLETGRIVVNSRYFRGFITVFGLLGVLSPLIGVYLISEGPRSMDPRSMIHLPTMLVFIGLWGGVTVTAGLDVSWYPQIAGAVIGITGITTFLPFFVGVLDNEIISTLILYEPIGITVGIILEGSPLGLAYAITFISTFVYFGVATLCFAVAFNE